PHLDLRLGERDRRAGEQSNAGLELVGVLRMPELLDRAVVPHALRLLERARAVRLLGADVVERVVLEPHREVAPHSAAHDVCALTDAVGLLLTDRTHTPRPVARAPRGGCVDLQVTAGDVERPRPRT